MFVKAPSGRQRLNVLAAVKAMTRDVFSVENLSYPTAETDREWLRVVAGAHPGLPLTIILDSARYQRCALVHTVAQTFGIELLYWPIYTPNLNLIERFWKFVKKQCLDSKYYPDSASFQQAILACIAQAPTTHKAALESLVPLRFQLDFSQLGR